jgi:DNA-binding NarL/FixJ family response regulator
MVLTSRAAPWHSGPAGEECHVERARAVGPPLRVVVVDDHEVVRSGLRNELAERRVEVVGEAGDVEAAVAAVRRHAPDVLVLDVRLPGGGAPAVLAALGEQAPPTLAVSASDERDDVVRTVAAGASGYLLKTAPVDRIVDAIRATRDGEPVFSAELAGHLLELDLGDAVEDPEWEALTEREREVLRFLARGHTYRRIGEQLHVVEKTVETHVRNILRKLQLTNRHEAARWAIERGFDAG